MSDEPIRDVESLSEHPQSIDSDEMDEAMELLEELEEDIEAFEEVEWELYAEPCPHCGGTEFLETCEQEQVVKCDENGEPEEFIPNGGLDTKEVWCRGCDTRLL